MKLKKVFILILLLVGFTLSGCIDSRGGSFKLTAKMLKENLKTQNFEPKNEVRLVDLGRYSVMNPFYSSLGAITVHNSSNEVSVFSLFTGDILFPFASELSINFILPSINSTMNYAVYVKVTDSNDNTQIYDLYGNILLEADKYSYVDVSITEEIIYDFYRNIIERAYYEVITYRYENKDNQQKTYRIDYYTGNRQLVQNNEEDDRKPKKYDLSILCLKGYFGYELNNNIYIYDKNDKHLNTFKINDSTHFYIANGKFISQMSYELDKDAQDYTYVSDGKKFKLDSNQVDLLTGKEKKLELDYILTSYEPFKDEKGNYKYVIAKVKKIVERNLDNTEYYVILDCNGKILKELEFSNINYLRAVDDYFVDLSTGSVFDNKMATILSLESIRGVSSKENLIIVKKSGMYGVVDKTGKTIIPFEYSWIDNDFAYGKILAIDTNNNKYLIDKNGTKELLDESIELLSYGIYFKKDSHINSNLISLYSYDGKKLASFSSTSTNYTTTRISNLYGDYDVYIFTDVDSEYAIVLNKTVRN